MTKEIRLAKQKEFLKYAGEQVSLYIKAPILISKSDTGEEVYAAAVRGFVIDVNLVCICLGQTSKEQDKSIFFEDVIGIELYDENQHSSFLMDGLDGTEH